MNVQAKIGLCNFVSTVCMLRISSGPEVVIGDPTHGVDDCDVIYDRLPNLIMITKFWDFRVLHNNFMSNPPRKY
jgi:hypothetical protein